MQHQEIAWSKGQTRSALVARFQWQLSQHSAPVQASRPSLTRNQTIPSEVAASTHHAPVRYWAVKPMTTTSESQPHVIDSTASALSARLPIFSASAILRLARKYMMGMAARA